MNYFNIPYPTPQVYKNKYIGKSALIIGTGHSTKSLLAYKKNIRDKFDVIIGTNLSIIDFESEMDFHIVLEKNPKKVYNHIAENGGRADLPRILNWKNIVFFSKHLKIIKSTRHNFCGKPNLREYIYNGNEGLLIGPQQYGLSVGSVMLNAIHFACILGCDSVYMIGADLLFRDQYDHYYPDNHYRKSTTKLANRSPIISVTHNDKEFKTTRFFKGSAEFIDEVVEKFCAPLGIKVFDFSDGLISKANKLVISKFMDK